MIDTLGNELLDPLNCKFVTLGPIDKAINKVIHVFTFPRKLFSRTD